MTDQTQRSFQRFKADAGVLVAVNSSPNGSALDGQILPGRINDGSLTGLSVFLREGLQADSQIEVSVKISEPKRMLTLKGRVAWTKLDAEKNEFLSGVQLETDQREEMAVWTNLFN